MKTLVRLMRNVHLIVGTIYISVLPALAQTSVDGPMINLTVENQPLGDVLGEITRETGYRFNLSQEWLDFPVSAAIDDLPLEQGLNRLLRNLNHTVVWEADQTVSIMVYGKVKPGSNDGSAVSFASPPRPVPPEPEPEPEIEEAPEAESEGSDMEQDEAIIQEHDGESRPQVENVNEESGEATE